MYVLYVGHIDYSPNLVSARNLPNLWCPFLPALKDTIRPESRSLKKENRERPNAHLATGGLLTLDWGFLIDIIRTCEAIDIVTSLTRYT